MNPRHTKNCFTVWSGRRSVVIWTIQTDINYQFYLSELGGSAKTAIDHSRFVYMYLDPVSRVQRKQSFPPAFLTSPYCHALAILTGPKKSFLTVLQSVIWISLKSFPFKKFHLPTRQVMDGFYLRQATGQRFICTLQSNKFMWFTTATVI